MTSPPHGNFGRCGVQLNRPFNFVNRLLKERNGQSLRLFCLLATKENNIRFYYTYLFLIREVIRVVPPSVDDKLATAEEVSELRLRGKHQINSTQRVSSKNNTTSQHGGAMMALMLLTGLTSLTSLSVPSLELFHLSRITSC